MAKDNAPFKEKSIVLIVFYKDYLMPTKTSAIPCLGFIALSS